MWTLSLEIFQNVLDHISLFFEYIFCSKSRIERIYPQNNVEIREILKQAHENKTNVKITAGTFPCIPSSTSDVIVDLRKMNKLIGLDVNQRTIVIESGMRLSEVGKILESVSMSLNIHGSMSDLRIVDAIAVGTFGGNAFLFSELLSVEVILSNGKIVVWSWTKNPEEMKSLCCGLGMIAIPSSVTLRIIPLRRYTEISYLCSIQELMFHWNYQFKSALNLQLLWFPYSELTVITYVNSTESSMDIESQSKKDFLIEKTTLLLANLTRRLSIPFSRISFVSKLLNRLHFFLRWASFRYRSDYAHLPINYVSSYEMCRGTSWLIPAESLPTVLYNISQWAQNYNCEDTTLGISSLVLQSFKNEGKNSMRAYLSPSLETPSLSLWYDWFVPIRDPNPVAIHEFEDIFISVGGIRTWSGERLTSPLVLSKTFPKYEKWCRNKSRLDPRNILSSAYIQGTVIVKNDNLQSNISSSLSSLLTIE